jgi:hypothetical protein
MTERITTNPFYKTTQESTSERHQTKRNIPFVGPGEMLSTRSVPERNAETLPIETKRNEQQRSYMNNTQEMFINDC